MGTTEEELARLQVAVQKAWDAAIRAGDGHPKPGTPEYQRWQNLIDAAVAAHLAHREAVNPNR